MQRDNLIVQPQYFLANRSSKSNRLLPNLPPQRRDSASVKYTSPGYLRISSTQSGRI